MQSNGPLLVSFAFSCPLSCQACYSPAHYTSNKRCLLDSATGRCAFSAFCQLVLGRDNDLRTMVFAFLEGHPPAARQKGQCACSPAVSLPVSALASSLLPVRCSSASLALRRLHPEDLQAEAVILYAKRQATPVCQSDGLSVVARHLVCTNACQCLFASSSACANVSLYSDLRVSQPDR